MELSSKELWSLVQPRMRAYMAQTWDSTVIEEVTGAVPKTVAFWLTQQEPPGGQIIKLWHLLSAFGYDSPELDSLPQFNRLCGEAYTFASVSIDDIKAATGQQADQGVVRVLRGMIPMHPALTSSDLLELYGETVQAAKDAFTMSPANPAQHTPVVTPNPAEVVVDEIAKGGDKVLIAAMLFNAALPLARYLDDDASQQDRSTLRTLMGEEVMFNLSNHFYNLCGERARSNRK
jgi:hypothetical protein